MRYIPEWKIEDYRTYVAESKACGQEYVSLSEYVGDTIYEKEED
jgi:hypothetical protein|tara:strand:- start:900 stop:1031 length:132 start_codon:yes stop_codon:yes gene_type:complete